MALGYSVGIAKRNSDVQKPILMGITVIINKSWKKHIKQISYLYTCDTQYS